MEQNMLDILRDKLEWIHVWAEAAGENDTTHPDDQARLDQIMVTSMELYGLVMKELIAIDPSYKPKKPTPEEIEELDRKYPHVQR